MTDDMIPADKVREIIDSMNEDLRTPARNEDWGKGYDRAASGYKAELEALLPEPRTLADELREWRSKAGLSIPASTHFSTLADRVEALEQERDIATGALKVEAEVTSEAIDRYEALSEELAAACVSVEEQAAEITRLTEQRDNACEAHDAAEDEIIRLSARELPDGWRIAEHPKFGTVLTDGETIKNGNVAILYLNDGKSDWEWDAPYTLSFRDEAPAPEETPEPEYIDPATCGPRHWYNVRLKSDGVIYDAVRINGEGMIRPWLVLGNRYMSAADTDLTVIRPLTSEELDVR